MRTSNPVLNDDVFRISDGNVTTMTLQGTVMWTLILLTFCVGGFIFTWDQATKGFTEQFAAAKANPQYSVDEKTKEKKQLPTQIDIPPAAIGYTAGGLLVGFLLSMVIIFNPQTAWWLGPIYATAEGLCLGGISAGFEAKYPGIVFNAAGCTFTTLLGLLIVYSTGMIRPSENFKLGVLSAMLGVLGLYFLDLGCQMFGLGYTSAIHGSSWLGIGISVFVVGLAAMNLVLDFDFIETGVQHRAPKYMEAYAAFGLMVTLVWLYLEILQLLAKLRSRND